MITILKCVIGTRFFNDVFSHPPMGDIYKQISTCISINTLFFFSETAVWNNFVSCMHISLGGLFIFTENECVGMSVRIDVSFLFVRSTAQQ